MLFACWFIQWENISKMSSFSWACMIHSGLFDLWMSLWFTVQISSAGQAARMLQPWHGQEWNSFCPLRNRCFILIQCSNPRLVSYCRKSVNLSWLGTAEGKWDHFISTRQGLIPFSESQNQYDFDQLLFISLRFTLLLSICREEIGIWPAPVCVCDFCFYFGPSVKFTLLQGCPPQSSFLIPMNSLCIPAPLSGLTLTFMCGSLGCLSRIVFVSCKARPVWFGSLFLKVPDSVALNEREW